MTLFCPQKTFLGRLFLFQGIKDKYLQLFNLLLKRQYQLLDLKTMCHMVEVILLHLFQYVKGILF